MPDSVRANIHATVIAVAEVMAGGSGPEGEGRNLAPPSPGGEPLLLVVIVAVLLNFVVELTIPRAVPSRLPVWERLGRTSRA